MGTIGGSPRRIPWQLVMVFLFFATAILLGGKIYFDKHAGQVKEYQKEDLESIALLKATQIKDWREERLADGWVVSLSPIFGEAVDRWLNNQKDIKLKNEIIERLNAFNRYKDYGKIFLVDGKNKVLIATDKNEIFLGSYTQALIAGAKGKKEVFFSDFYYCNSCQTVHLDVIAPIMKNSPTGKRVVGTLIMRINPHHFLYPSIQRWPTLSASAETYLVKKEADHVLFLNELRLKENTALKFKIPLTNSKEIAVKAITGGEGTVEGLDYTGENSLASVKKIPSSDWVVVAKINEKELFSDVYRHARYTLLMVGILILTTAVIIGFIWYRQQKDFYRKQYMLEQEKQLLNQRYQFLTRNANDVILLSDSELNVLDANERAVSVYGYSMEELLKMKVTDLRTAEAAKAITEDLKKVRDESGNVYETVHRKKDNSVFPAEVSCRWIEIEGKKYYQGIIRDISERKRNEQALLEKNRELARMNQQLLAADQELQASDEELRNQLAALQESREELWKSEQRYRSIFENTGTASIIIENDTTISLANAEFEKLSGYSLNEIEGRMKWTNFVWKYDLERMMGYHRQRRIDRKSAPIKYEFRFIDRIGRVKDIFLTVDIIPGTDKSVASLLDITNRKAAEEKIKASLREKEVMLKEIYHRVKNNLQVISSLLNLQAGYLKDPKDKEMFKESQNRILSMSLVHENLYKSPDLARVDFYYYVRNLIGDLMKSYGVIGDNINVEIDIQDITLGVDIAIPCGLLINEIVSNSFKHAFKGFSEAGRKGNVKIALTSKEKILYILKVSDDGIGLNEDINLKNPVTLGLQLINTLVEQIEGTVSLEKEGGAKYIIEFRKPN